MKNRCWRVQDTESHERECEPNFQVEISRVGQVTLSLSDGNEDRAQIRLDESLAGDLLIIDVRNKSDDTEHVEGWKRHAFLLCR